MREDNCPKCGSSDYSVFLEIRVISHNSKKRESIVECDDCGFEWKLEL